MTAIKSGSCTHSLFFFPPKLAQSKYQEPLHSLGVPDPVGTGGRQRRHSADPVDAEGIRQRRHSAMLASLAVEVSPGVGSKILSSKSAKVSPGLDDSHILNDTTTTNEECACFLSHRIKVG